MPPSERSIVNISIIVIIIINISVIIIITMIIMISKQEVIDVLTGTAFSEPFPTACYIYNARGPLHTCKIRKHEKHHKNVENIKKGGLENTSKTSKKTMSLTACENP